MEKTQNEINTVFGLHLKSNKNGSKCNNIRLVKSYIKNIFYLFCDEKCWQKLKKSEAKVVPFSQHDMSHNGNLIFYSNQQRKKKLKYLFSHLIFDIGTWAKRAYKAMNLKCQIILVFSKKNCLPSPYVHDFNDVSIFVSVWIWNTTPIYLSW